ncbi:MAG: NAD(P)-dependent oxidoreductase [Gammaproteobacteria bacterium RIFCSPLOWO2_02_FULL_42_14]|nr:MAG: NAD(P)-dependent oxidoreductase [Gammaproteobacteria bacterium RIFCSPHIGHO2_02_FULL_42_43]OGT28213.1 MAG: NAD(P)-dependent oxidoreductase [Gammaproteobacteria bacterium RIFCSPHIGHO2_01_FULL_42_8]OGT51214.1 MAG: NAD(P)-dependent oxidoreductase [Gammaproteobacteria bacterium RIFCSPHIGHO2_12_FULL_41_25]OGT62975.1 MAG: NAD(P)-dependent oxidoreductase [Gammaproteobacteria bacterium RIFCSPLOWO2_02_FULL_42_14]OGT86108.1 MAG: NAD(P)-dependent oxidoreductase [Gammaproteobacteria bacterium RIFCSP
MLKNKIVLITGASSGIGAACATYFARAGAKLVLCARRIDLLNQLTEKLKSEYHSDIFSFQLDVRDRNAVEKKIAAIPETFQTIDIVVNSAGLAAGLDLIQEGNVDDWDTMIDTNVKGLLYVTRAILPGMVARGTGHIVNIGSISGRNVYVKGAVYCATKYAVRALTEGLREDLLGTSIRVTSVDPGAVETNFSVARFKGDTERAKKVYQGFTPLTPDDVADAIFYCVTRPAHINIRELVLLPTDQVSVTSVARRSLPTGRV